MTTRELLTELVNEYRARMTPTPDRLEQLRARVQAAMQTDSRADATISRRLRNIGARPVAVRAAAAIVLVAAGIQLGRLSSSPVHSDAAATAIDEGLPIRSLTPGAVANISANALCASRPAEKPPIPAAVRMAVLRDYRMEDVPARQYELDYLITPELGGIPDRRNLWPERYVSGLWNAARKDELEDLLPRLVCDGQLDLTTAQQDIARDWIAAYKKYFGTDRPVDRRAGLVLGRDTLLFHLRQHDGLKVVVLERDRFVLRDDHLGGD
jgi:hypothetical protein